MHKVKFVLTFIKTGIFFILGKALKLIRAAILATVIVAAGMFCFYMAGFMFTTGQHDANAYEKRYKIIQCYKNKACREKLEKRKKPAWRTGNGYIEAKDSNNDTKRIPEIRSTSV